MHENLVAHCDLGLHNAAINLLGDERHIGAVPHLRDTSVVRYAIYDFGHSLIYPPGTPSHMMRDARPDPFATSLEPRDPFAFDVHCLGGLLRRLLKV